jgi:hypothetical protein
MARKIYTYLALFCLIILGSYRGYIAVWMDSGPEPTKVFPYSTQSLPPEDQKRLEKGIQITSAEELYSLLQDYLS